MRIGAPDAPATAFLPNLYCGYRVWYIGNLLMESKTEYTQMNSVINFQEFEVNLNCCLPMGQVK